MTAHAVHWGEGVFLKPHHFQMGLRFQDDQMRRQHMWDSPYGWGLQSIDLDREALGDHRVIVHRLSARFPDGTALEVGPDEPLPERNLYEIFRTRRQVDLFVGVPELVLGASWANLANEADSSARFRAREMRCLDENTGLNPQTILVRRLNARLLFGDEDRAGYQVLPIARVVKSGGPDATPELDREFIPPLLRCDIWPPLQSDILYAVVERILRKIDDLAQRVKKEGIAFDRVQRDGGRILHQLAKLNEAASVMRVLLHVQGLHPVWAFMELSRLVGQLAIFSAERRTPHGLPRYNHDNLYDCFSGLKACLDLFLNIVEDPKYQSRVFRGKGRRMQVALESTWLEPGWRLFLGVYSALDEKACTEILTRPGQLNMKIGSSDRVDELFSEGHSGLRFSRIPRAPQALPVDASMIYFQIQHEGQDQEWAHVQRSLQLAMRLRQELILGNIDGKHQLSIRTGDKTASFEFTLFAVPPNVPD
ncbi:MAG: type VI secretion system baseplate subunit TssK [Gemmataceae bacterium]|nr:type VI secretion system baseplate subunit TssK [Gemmataceae bacterium]